MTEKEWMQCNDPAIEQILELPEQSVSKHICVLSEVAPALARQFSPCSGCLALWREFQDDWRSVRLFHYRHTRMKGQLSADCLWRHLLQVTLQYTAGIVTLRECYAKTIDYIDYWHYEPFRKEARSLGKSAIEEALGRFRIAENARKHEAGKLLRCIFGNPFRTVVLNQQWLTPIVKTLAEQIENDRAFDRMPVLGDALEDAGCHNTDILDHCRQLEPHVRGCWCLDLILRKE
jgi:hypothetical protein